MNNTLITKRERFEKILEALNYGIFERKDHINKAFLAAMSGEAIFLLGPPGVAKSLIARRLKYAFKDAKSFEYLMNRFSTPEEIFGPLSIAKLRDEDKLERKVESYLPNANIAFLDEIWKAGPSIQNTLLTIINEKIFRNGSNEIKVPLIGLIAASNELPTPNMGLEALWDRFIIRMVVNNIKDMETFASMITSTENLLVDNVNNKLKITIGEYDKWQKEIDKIDLSKEIIPLIQYVRVLIQNYNQDDANDRIYISDRRWKKIINVLRTSAYINGRDYVDLMDCFLIEDMIWDNPSQIEHVQRIIREAIGKNSYAISINYSEISDAIENLHKEIKDEIEIITSVDKKEFKIIRHKKLENLYEIKIVKNRNTKEYYDDLKEIRYLKIKKAKNNIFKMSVNDSFELFDENFSPVFVSYEFTRSDSDSFTIYDFSYDIYCKYKIISKTFTENKIKYKEPHKLLISDWNARFDKITEKINDLEKFLKYKENNEFATLKMNLFVESERSEIILENLEMTKKNLKKLLLQIDEIKHYYENINTGETKIIIEDDGNFNYDVDEDDVDDGNFNYDVDEDDVDEDDFY